MEGLLSKTSERSSKQNQQKNRFNKSVPFLRNECEITNPVCYFVNWHPGALNICKSCFYSEAPHYFKSLMCGQSTSDPTKIDVIPRTRQRTSKGQRDDGYGTPTAHTKLKTTQMKSLEMKRLTVSALFCLMWITFTILCYESTLHHQLLYCRGLQETDYWSSLFGELEEAGSQTDQVRAHLELPLRIRTTFYQRNHSYSYRIHVALTKSTSVSFMWPGFELIL